MDKLNDIARKHNMTENTGEINTILTFFSIVDHVLTLYHLICLCCVLCC